jgi:hypothetical protein
MQVTTQWLVAALSVKLIDLLQKRAAIIRSERFDK